MVASFQRFYRGWQSPGLQALPVRVEFIFVQFSPRFKQPRLFSRQAAGD
jgi:hypothetical protein